MSISTLINRPCQLVLVSDGEAEDDYGNKIPEETTVDAVCELQQRRREEAGEQGETSTTEWTAFFLPGVELDSASKLIVDGATYEFTGDPWEARNPNSQVCSHVEGTVKRVA